MDDIQFLSNKIRLKEENYFIYSIPCMKTIKQIIFSSGQHPNFIPGLEERLKSFGAGMIVDIAHPGVSLGLRY